ncbi:MAG: hypothetical protein GXP29_15200 [Planctomycetes bacterium]|nr:hypothetical protein [Planctomycetota bacterium]
MKNKQYAVLAPNEDGFFDRDELDGCSNPANPTSVPSDGDVDIINFALFETCLAGLDNATGTSCQCSLDMDLDTEVDLADFRRFQSTVGS